MNSHIVVDQNAPLANWGAVSTEKDIVLRDVAM